MLIKIIIQQEWLKGVTELGIVFLRVA